MQFIGNEQLVSFFDNAIAKGSLSHAYCLAGPEGVGKRTLARLISAKLTEVWLEKLDSHPDFIYLRREEDEKTGKLKKDISIKQARELKERLANSSWFKGKRVVIIDEAELLNEESGNALLKFLEETEKNTIFFLLTTNENALLPTVRSRCQLFYLSLVPIQEIIAGLKKMDYEEQTAKEVALLSRGRPGRAIAMAEEPGARQDYLNELKRWENIVGRPLYARLKAIEDLFSDKTDANRQRDVLQQKLEIWIMGWRDKMLKETNDSAARLRAAEVIAKLQEAKAMIRQNVNAKLVVENVLLNIT